MVERLILERDGKDWPHRDVSRLVKAGGMQWHVQIMGSGPVFLLLHGTGASTHSWRGLMPLLARNYKVLAADLPGHGFSDSLPYAVSLPGVAKAVTALLNELNLTPDFAAAHSAGAAILLRMALDGSIKPKAIVSLNGALLPFRGAVSQFFSPLAKIMFLNPFVPRFFAWSAANPATVKRLIEDTGSRIDDEGLALYARLFRNPAHVAGALGMMAGWDLKHLADDLPRLRGRLLLIAGGKDKAISPGDAHELRALLPSAELIVMRHLGHLAHEEAPEEIASLITGFVESPAMEAAPSP
jgi:magnesium chelatase accessory protein